MTKYWLDDAFWIDGEWLSWDDIPDEEEECETELQRLEREAALRFRYPNADPKLIGYYEDLLDLAQNYHFATSRHLEVYGVIGELHGAVKYGIKLHKKPHAQGSDGRLGDDFVEIKTLSPMNRTEAKPVTLQGRNFSKLLMVRIDEAFRVKSYLVDRRELRKRGKSIHVSWEGMRAQD